MNVHELMQKAEPHITIVNAFAKAWDVLGRYRNPVCSISGGADSDIMLDMIHAIDDEHKVRYVWFNTGLEFTATKRHLDFLRDKYSIEIEPLAPIKPVALTVKEHGYPFLAKIVSARIAQLQRHGFDFKDGHVYEDDLEQYPRCKNALNWWHNKYSFKMWNINRHKLLKEFLIAHPPTFHISDKCCDFSKKKVAHKFIDDNNCDLNIIGTRKSEGGIRQAHNSCFNADTQGIATFRPIFWFNNQDKENYCNAFGVIHSDCYTVYGLKRTGCAGCPFNPNVFTEVEQVKPYEAGIIQAAEHVFAPAYEYTKLFREFRVFHDKKAKET